MVDLQNSVLSKNPACNVACRACHYKDLDYSTQLEKKNNWAEKQLGAWQKVLNKILPAPAKERIAYRSKTWLRSQFKNGDLSFGMLRSIRVEGEWEKELVSWNTCPLHIQPIQQMIENLRRILPQAAQEFVENAMAGVWIGVPHLVIISSSTQPAFGFEKLKNIDWNQILVPPFDRVWFHCNPQVGKKIFGHHQILQLTGPPVEDAHPIRAFRQVAQSLLVEARNLAVEFLLEGQPEMVVDLYCGTGELSKQLPSSVGWIGIEISSEAVIYANSLIPHERPIHSAFVGMIEHRLSDPRALSLITGNYALYINPPRSGLSDQAKTKLKELILKNPPTSIAYLSCSASSLARDLGELESCGYQIISIQPFDFFPQTEHFESLAFLIKK